MLIFKYHSFCLCGKLFQYYDMECKPVDSQAIDDAEETTDWYELCEREELMKGTVFGLCDIS
jgi:hypothetical protein